MKKITRPFTFSYTVTETVVENLKLVKKEVATLDLHCEGYKYPFERYGIENDIDVHIDYAYYDEKDILPILRITELYSDIANAAMAQAEKQDYRTPAEKYSDICSYIYSLVKNEYFYLPSPLIVQEPLTPARFTADAICISPSNVIYLGIYTGEGGFFDWHQVENNDEFILDLISSHMPQIKDFKVV